jgi:hypothetical protein
MRLRRSPLRVATATLLAAAGVSAPARAQSHLDWRAAFTTTGAYTRTISDSPDPTAQTFSGPLLAFGPSLVALLDTPRTESTLTYAFALSIPFAVGPTAQSTPVSYSNRLTYAGHYALSEVTSATLGGIFIFSPLNAVDPTSDPTATPIQAVPNDVAYLLSVSVNEGIQRQLSETTSFAQVGSFMYADPIDPINTPPSTYTATNGFTLTRSFWKDTIGGTLSTQANFFTAGQSSSLPLTPATSAYINTLTANYSHAFSEAFSGALTAGVSQTLSPGATTFMVIEPTGTLSLNYAFNLATAGLSYAHSAMPNVTIGTVSLVDMVSLRFAIPIGVTGLATVGTAGYTHSEPLPGATVTAAAADAGLATTNVFVGDVGLTYTPRRVETLTFGVRGQITRQFSSGQYSGDATALVNDLTRYTISLNVTYSYPSANAALVRPSFSPLYSAQMPAPAEIVSTDRFFGDPVGGASPPEPPPKPVKVP